MTIYNIAQLAGVSIATVSRVINNYPHVKNETRQRIMDILGQYSYVPNATARSLAANKSKTIGVMITDIRQIHHANIAYTVEQAMNTLGYSTILCNAGRIRKNQIAYLRVLAEKQVDGIIMVGSVFSNKDILQSIHSYLSSTPILMHNGYIKTSNIYSVRTEPHFGIQLAIDHLYQKCHRHIGFVQDYQTWAGRMKFRSFRECMQSYTIKAPYNIAHVFPGITGGRQAALELLKNDKKISSIIAGDDLTAIGVIKELGLQKKRVPADIAVIGHNNSLFAEISSPPLTSIDSKIESLGTLLAQTMIRVFKGEDVPPVQKIQPELIVREST